MQWLSKIVDDIEKLRPAGDILIESGGSPSGTYHLGHLRELIICDAILWELQRRGRTAKHIYYSDDLDALRKVPVNVPSEYEKYLGMPLYRIPAPDGSDRSYAQFFHQDLADACAALNIEVEFISTHTKYESGFFESAIELALEHTGQVRDVLETVSGHKLGDEWSPVQINEDGYLKKRRFVSIDKQTKTINYLDKNAHEQTISYKSGDVKLDWRIDWPARWWLLRVDVEPFGRDHATKGGSYETGAELIRKIFKHEPPMPVAYDFVNLVGDTKKMSASKGTGLDAVGTVQVLPPEIVRYFMLRFPPAKRLYFDPIGGVAQLIDEFAELLAKEPQSSLAEVSQRGAQPIVTRVPFSHLVASYQASLRDIGKTMDLLKRTDYALDDAVVRQELGYIDQWLQKWAPEDIKFDLLEKIDPSDFSDEEKSYLSGLAKAVESAPETADGEWFHKAIYQFKENDGLNPKQLFSPLYRALIGKEQGPRAGWFLSILPRDWLIKRLRFEA